MKFTCLYKVLYKNNNKIKWQGKSKLIKFLARCNRLLLLLVHSNATSVTLTLRKSTVKKKIHTSKDVDPLVHRRVLRLKSIDLSLTPLQQSLRGSIKIFQDSNKDLTHNKDHLLHSLFMFVQPKTSIQLSILCFKKN